MVTIMIFATPYWRFLKLKHWISPAKTYLLRKETGKKKLLRGFLLFKQIVIILLFVKSFFMTNLSDKTRVIHKKHWEEEQ